MDIELIINNVYEMEEIKKFVYIKKYLLVYKNSQDNIIYGDPYRKYKISSIMPLDKYHFYNCESEEECNIYKGIIIVEEIDN